MIYYIAEQLSHYYSFFNVVHYVSFRALASLMSTLFLSIALGNYAIRFASYYFRSDVRPWTPESHKQKNNTPTMGGVFIIAAILINGLLWCNLADPQVWVFFLCLVGFGALGFWDDWNKVKYKKGISARTKFVAQCVIALTVVLAWLYASNPHLTLCIPVFKNLCPYIGLLIIPWAIFILVATSNAVNLTDGLDGLAISSLITTYSTFSIILYLAGHKGFAWYLSIPYAHSAELVVLGATLVGASLGFLWFNAYPAQIFMGDVGSISLGAVLALLALMSRQELLLPIAGGIFVVETLSVMIQVLSVKLTGKRFFRMAPIHHHFELIGWHESKITVRWGIISLVLCLIALMLLKVR